MSEKSISSPDLPRPGALQAINNAALAIASKLSYEATLEQIAESARDVTGARYAAIGEFNPAGEIEAFVTSGMTEEEVDKIDHRPHGLGLLGALLEDAEPIRLTEISDDPRSVGFPEHHPVMVTFLGVPIKSGSTVLGNLYLTDKEGGEPFTHEDQDMILLLANHAAVAIENAHLYEASQARARELKARNRELAAVNAVARAMSEHLDIEGMLRKTLAEVLSVTGMDAGEVFLLDEDTDQVKLAIHFGDDPESFHSEATFPIGHGFPGKVIESGAPLTTSNLDQEREHLRASIIEAGYQTFACIPIQLKGHVIGTLGLASKHSRTFPERDLSLLEAIGHQVGVAVENARLYGEIERLAVLEERSRIGMDLHDGVIQSIYAVGLTLETTRLLFRDNPDQAHELLDEAIEGLNEAIRDIRNFILDLRPRRFEGELGDGLARLVREFQANTMVEVEIEAPHSLVDSLPADQARALFLTAQEALANVARHARAERVELTVSRDDGNVVLQVVDDGRGFDLQEQSQSVGHGLANMQSRAEELGGEFSVESEPGEGTCIRMSLPEREP